MDRTNWELQLEHTELQSDHIELQLDHTELQVDHTEPGAAAGLDHTISSDQTNWSVSPNRNN